VFTVGVPRSDLDLYLGAHKLKSRVQVELTRCSACDVINDKPAHRHVLQNSYLQDFCRPVVLPTRLTYCRPRLYLLPRWLSPNWLSPRYLSPKWFVAQASAPPDMLNRYYHCSFLKIFVHLCSEKETFSAFSCCLYCFSGTDKQ